MTMLNGWTVIVTRPAHQAAGLASQLESAGARVFAWPTLTIEPITIDDTQRERWSTDRHDWLVYTSANAVEHASRLWRRPPRARVAAIGRATARALRARGIDVDLTPTAGADSEALLATTAFSAVQGQRILIVTGQGGRDALRKALAARGANVAVAELYARRTLMPAPDALAALEHELVAGPVVVSATSVDVFEALLQGLPVTLQQAIVRNVLLVPGERVAAAARAAGWLGTLVIADSAEDDQMVAALVDWLATGTDEHA
jgi:uroporphyrinogen-III synthase